MRNGYYVTTTTAAYLAGLIEVNKPRHSGKRNGYKTRARAATVRNAKKASHKAARAAARAALYTV